LLEFLLEFLLELGMGPSQSINLNQSEESSNSKTEWEKSHQPIGIPIITAFSKASALPLVVSAPLPSYVTNQPFEMQQNGYQEEGRQQQECRCEGKIICERRRHEISVRLLVLREFGTPFCWS
jgi:hypothetical protein